jgi:two-component system, sensor histidine kinase
MPANILIAEDEAGIRTALTILLEGEGYAVKTVKDGDEALAAVRGEHYDLLISDIRMPGINGLQLLEEVAKVPGRPEIIVMTAYGSIETAIQALKTGARDFLLKPFSNDLLKMTVQRALKIHELSEENRRLRELENMKREFITMIAHELRTPLTAIKGYLKLVQCGMVGELKDMQKEYLGVVQQNTDKLREIIDKMMVMSSLEMNELSLEPVSANTLSVIWEAIAEVQDAYEKKQLNLEVNLAASLKPIYVDPFRMRQIVTFLLDNAIAFSPAHRRISLSVDRFHGLAALGGHKVPISYVDLSDLQPGEYLEVSVSDEGPGIPEEKLSQIFEKFYQIEDLYIRQVGGMGIGLSLCKKLVHLMGGKIWVQSRMGEGCKFTFILPWRDQAEDSVSQNQTQNQSQSRAA